MSDLESVSFGNEVLVHVDSGIGVLSLNRPHRHNALSDGMENEFFESLRTLRGRDLSALILRGEGQSFCSGRDTDEFGVREAGTTDYEWLRERHERTLRLLVDFPVPVIAALKGWVLGGGLERALLCDIRIAASDATLGYPELDFGVIPDCGGIWRLYEIGGPSLAAELVLTGRNMEAEEALRRGIVSHVVDPEDLDSKAFELANQIANRPAFVRRIAYDLISGLGRSGLDETLTRIGFAQSLAYPNADYGD